MVITRHSSQEETITANLAQGVPNRRSKRVERVAQKNVDVAATAREEDNEAEAEQLVLKMKGKRMKTVASKKKNVEERVDDVIRDVIEDVTRYVNAEGDENVEVATTSRVEANDQDNEVEEEQPVLKTRGKRVKTVASKKKNVEVATTSREEANDQDNGEENHDVEDEQPLSKMKGKRVKKTIAPKKRKVQGEEFNDDQEQNVPQVNVHEERVQIVSTIPKKKREGQLHMVSSPYQMGCLCGKLNEKQRSDVKQIGFGGLLLLNIKMSYHGLAKYFIKNYDVSTSVFIVNRYCKYTITEYDVCDIFGLPLTDNDVIKRSNSSEDMSEYDLFEEWQQKLDCVGNKDISADQLLSKMLLDLIDGGDDFKRFFVMYALITYLAPTSHRTVDLSLLKPLVDVNEIKNLNWCGLVFDRFRSGLERCQTKNLKNIPSCLAILEICFYHRVSSLGVFPSSRLPLIQHWNYESLKSRAQLELKARSFGLGDFDGETYPISKKLGKKVLDEEVELEDHGMFLKIPIPDGLLASSDQQIHDTAADELTEEVSKMKRNIEIVTQHHLSKLLKLKAKGNQIQEQSSNSPTLSQWYSDPKVVEEIDAIMDRIRVVKKRTADIDLPSFDLGISDLEKTPSPASKLAAKKRGKKKI